MHLVPSNTLMVLTNGIGGDVMSPRSHLSRREFVAASIAAAAWPAVPGLAASQDLATLTLKQASDLIRRREASPVDLTQACLSRIDKYNPSINAFITVTRDQALATAREMEAEPKKAASCEARCTVFQSPLKTISIQLARRLLRRALCSRIVFRLGRRSSNPFEKGRCNSSGQ